MLSLLSGTLSHLQSNAVPPVMPKTPSHPILGPATITTSATYTRVQTPNPKSESANITSAKERYPGPKHQNFSIKFRLTVHILARLP